MLNDSGKRLADEDARFNFCNSWTGIVLILLIKVSCFVADKGRRQSITEGYCTEEESKGRRRDASMFIYY